MSFKKKALLTSATMTAIAVPFVSVVSCSSFFKDHELFDNGNFVFDYYDIENPTQNNATWRSAEQFNDDVVSKDKYLFGASLGAKEIYDVNGTKPEIIGISPEKAMTTNGIFMANTFSERDMVDFSQYLQTLWWVSNWSKNLLPSDANLTFNNPSQEYQSRVLDKFKAGEPEKSIFIPRDNSVAEGTSQNSIFTTGKLINNYEPLFKDLDMRFPKMYKPGSTIETTFGIKNTYNGTLSQHKNDDIIRPTLLQPFYPASMTEVSGLVDFNSNGLTGGLDEEFFANSNHPQDSDIYQFLNNYVPYTYANYKPLDENVDASKKIRIVILDDAFVPTDRMSDHGDGNYGPDNKPGTPDDVPATKRTKNEDIRQLSEILRNDGVNLSDEKEFDGIGIKVVSSYSDTESKYGIEHYLNDSNSRTIAIMPINEWASHDDSNSSLMMSYRVPARLSSLNVEYDENNKPYLDGSTFRIDESYALGLITTYFDLWINKPSDSKLIRTNYALDELKALFDMNGNLPPTVDVNDPNFKDIYSEFGRLEWTDEARELYFNPLRDLADHYDKSFPHTPGSAKFRTGAKYDYDKHMFVDDVETRLFSEGINPFIYYSTNSDDISKEMDYNSQVIENRIMNKHGDGKINLRNEMFLPVHVAMYKALTFGDANITEAVKAWIEEHFTIE